MTEASTLQFSRRRPASLQAEGLSPLLPGAAVAGSRAQNFITVLTLAAKRLRCAFVSRLSLTVDGKCCRWRKCCSGARSASSSTETSSLLTSQGTCCARGEVLTSQQADSHALSIAPVLFSGRASSSSSATAHCAGLEPTRAKNNRYEMLFPPHGAMLSILARLSLVLCASSQARGV